MTLTDNTLTGSGKITAEELREWSNKPRNDQMIPEAIYNQLRAARRIDTLQAKVAELEGHIEDFGIEEERFDGECWNALKYVLTNTPGFDWSNYDPGIQSAEAVEFLIGNIQETKNAIEKLSQERDQARANLAKSNKLIQDIYEQAYEHLPNNCAIRAAKIIVSTNLAAAKTDSPQIADQVSDAKPFSHESKSGTPDPRDLIPPCEGTTPKDRALEHSGPITKKLAGYIEKLNASEVIIIDKEIERLQATIAMQREAMEASVYYVERLQDGVLGVPVCDLGEAEAEYTRLSKQALSTPPSDFIERIKREEREAVSKEQANDLHYFQSILLRLERAHGLEDEPNHREQISDEYDWLQGRIEDIRARSPEIDK